MSVILDLLGSSLIGGIIFMLVFKLNLFTQSALLTSDSELKLQQNAKTIAEILNYDLRKAGYKCDSTLTPIIIADSQRIKFYAEIDTTINSAIDNVEFCISDSTVASSTQNPNDIILYRVFNGDTLKGPSLGLTSLKFSYFNHQNKVTTVLDSIKYIKVEITVQGDNEIEDIFGEMNYQHTYWEMTINPRNL
jgi:Tfp pilus assembly protein PilW